MCVGRTEYLYYNDPISDFECLHISERTVTIVNASMITCMSYSVISKKS